MADVVRFVLILTRPTVVGKIRIGFPWHSRSTRQAAVRFANVFSEKVPCVWSVYQLCEMIADRDGDDAMKMKPVPPLLVAKYSRYIDNGDDDVDFHEVFCRTQRKADKRWPQPPACKISSTHSVSSATQQKNPLETIEEGDGDSSDDDSDLDDDGAMDTPASAAIIPWTTYPKRFRISLTSSRSAAYLYATCNASWTRCRHHRCSN
ncbi:Aste57867_18136 [Aphanomyces stellatus]|uniref:Aste57867_18136 protein n=1 Tax=Aphanomyces stellatus TaxID=120398 RepID=A0A485LAW8_9STRA|nr:hypothetical protein As57867_018074 [Aphanomyces stellatus]VFT94874.1 Aste57867_18136 [Aphanomyces stellatus]